MTADHSPARGADPAPDLELANPLLRHLGVRLVDSAPGHCEFRLDIAPQHLNRAGNLHGGVIATLLDAACGYAGLHEAGGVPAGNSSTLMLAVSYLAATGAGGLRAVGRLTGGGRGIYFSAGEVLADDGRLLATAQGSFKRTAATPAG